LLDDGNIELTLDQSETDELTSQGAFGGKNKVLVINRLLKKENGEVEWKSEVINDGRVINAYLRYRKLVLICLY
jgi:hypothetical protein